MPITSSASNERDGSVDHYPLVVPAGSVYDFEIKFAFFARKETRVLIMRDSSDGKLMAEFSRPKDGHYPTPVDSTQDRTYYLKGQYKDSPTSEWAPCKWQTKANDDGSRVIGWEDTVSSDKFNDIYAVIKKISG